MASPDNHGLGTYVLLSACKNEAHFIHHCLESVVAQTVQPLAWLIVDDGSTDNTADIIESYLLKLPSLILVRLPAGRARCFGSKDRAIQHAYGIVRHLDFRFVGVLDTDVGLESKDYFYSVLRAFDSDPRLGVTGGVVCEEENGVFHERKINVPWSVAGCVQMFRRDCFDAIGGFTPLKFGGSDTCAELQIRMLGWETRSLSHLRVFHYRPTSSASGIVRGCYRAGLAAGSFGSHPLFILAKVVRRMIHKPWFIGAAFFGLGYVSYRLRRGPRVIPQKVAAQLRHEQVGRLKSLLRGGGFALPSKVGCAADR
jgi:glycosyltransferase involved in cell wall biosynthesis